jgi:hypothetical protein
MLFMASLAGRIFFHVFKPAKSNSKQGTTPIFSTWWLMAPIGF